MVQVMESVVTNYYSNCQSNRVNINPAIEKLKYLTFKHDYVINVIWDIHYI